MIEFKYEHSRAHGRTQLSLTVAVPGLTIIVVCRCLGLWP